MTDAQRVPAPLQRPSPARLLTAEETERLHGVPAATVRSWAHRGKLFPVGAIPGRHGGRDSPLYDETKLRPLIAAWKSRRPETPQEKTP